MTRAICCGNEFKLALGGFGQAWSGSSGPLQPDSELQQFQYVFVYDKSGATELATWTSDAWVDVSHDHRTIVIVIVIAIVIIVRVRSPALTGVYRALAVTDMRLFWDRTRDARCCARTHSENQPKEKKDKKKMFALCPTHLSDRLRRLLDCHPSEKNK